MNVAIRPGMTARDRFVKHHQGVEDQGTEVIHRQFASVVVAGLQDHEIVAVDEIDEPVLLIDPPGPRALHAVLQLLRLANALERLAQAASMSRLIRLRTLRSAVCQCL